MIDPQALTVVNLIIDFLQLQCREWIRHQYFPGFAPTTHTENGHAIRHNGEKKEVTPGPTLCHAGQVMNIPRVPLWLFINKGGRASLKGRKVVKRQLEYGARDNNRLNSSSLRQWI